jgi:hypothetical protein
MSHLVEPIEVLRRDQAPAHFLWRSRLYVVRDVLDQWTETEPWQESAAGPSAVGGHGRLSNACAATEPHARARAAIDVDGFEHQIWRVLASRGRLGPTAEYDLRRTWPGGGWSVICPMTLAHQPSAIGLGRRSG